MVVWGSCMNEPAQRNMLWSVSDKLLTLTHTTIYLPVMNEPADGVMGYVENVYSMPGTTADPKVRGTANRRVALLKYVGAGGGPRGRLEAAGCSSVSTTDPATVGQGASEDIQARRVVRNQ